MNNQSKTRPDWVDEAGNNVPFSQLKKKEKVLERVTFKIAAEAKKVNAHLVKFHQGIQQQVNLAIDAIMKEYSGKKTEFKGNYTLYNFDRSIKVCVKVSQPIKFDEITIEQARQLLNEFLSDGITAKNSFVKQMVLEAFETRRGQMDTKRVMGLQRYADRISDVRYKRAMELIQQAIRRPETATYYQVWVRNGRGQYEAIKLDLAAL